MAVVHLKGNPIHTNGETLKTGAAAPDFKLVNNDLQDRSLKDYADKYKVISFVPSLDTSVCSIASKKFNEKMKAFPQAVVLVVSCDLPFAQKRWCGQEDAKNVETLSMMRSKECAEKFGVLLKDGPLEGLCARAVFVLDQDNKVIYQELVPEITQEPNYEKAMAVLS